MEMIWLAVEWGEVSLSGSLSGRSDNVSGIPIQNELGIEMFPKCTNKLDTR